MLADRSKRAVEVGSCHHILSDGSLVAYTEWDTSWSLRKVVVDLHPRSFRADHEMHFCGPRRIRI